MKASNNIIEFIKGFESLHDGDLSEIGLQPKLCPAGIWTEGYGRAMRLPCGHFLKGIGNRDFAEKNRTITTELEAAEALKQDLKIYENIVCSKIYVPLTQNQYDAVLSHTYNTGGSATLFKLINNNAASDKIRSWFENHYIKSSGVLLRGLVKRRKAEADLYFTL